MPTEPVKLVLPFPPSTNRYWRNWRGRQVVSAEAREYKEAVGWIVRKAMREPLTGDVAVTVEVYRPRKSRDLDNCLKIVFDALNGIAYNDDNQITEIYAFRYDDKANPRVNLTIAAIGAGVRAAA
jgi:crossover junction endodeoxyribonuclease RusA